MDIQSLVEPDRVHKTRLHRPADLRPRDGRTSSSGLGLLRPRVADPERRRLLRGDDRPPADDHGAQRRPQRSTCCTTAARTAACSSSATCKGNTGDAFVCSYHAWSFHLDGKVRAIPLARGYEGTRMTADNPDCNVKRAARVDSYRGFVFASLAADGPSLLRVPRRGQDRLRRHVRPLAGRRGRDRADLPPRDPAVELEVLHGEPARRAAPVGDAPVAPASRPAASSSASRSEKGVGAAVLPLPVGLRVELRAVGRRADHQLPAAATASSRPTWACARRTPTRSSTRRC